MNISVRTLKENDLSEADRIFRLAFGTFLGLPNPMTCFGDADYVRTRFYADPSTAYGAIIVDEAGGNENGRLIGSNFISNWGSVGFFGPLTVHPDYWSKGVARSLLVPTMQHFSRWNTRHVGLFTFAQSPKHISLYQKFGFWPYFLTAIMSKDVSPIMDKNSKSTSQPIWSKYSEASKDQEVEKQGEGYLLNACRRLTNTIYAGLDLSIEITSVIKQRLGDIVLIWDLDINNNNKNLAGFAICHCGKGTEAGSNTCYVKFAAAQPRRTDDDAPLAGRRFEGLLNACIAFAAEEGLSRLVAGANTGRQQAYAKMLSYGFRIDMLGIAMQKGYDAGYNRPDVYIIDDWR
jgi:GNAT superfamily N-acetyltransferase